MEEIINKVAKSGLITLDLEEFCDKEVTRKTIDLKELLFQGMILREKDIRNFIKEHNWEQYKGDLVNIYCSTDSIIPNWAYMLITSSLNRYTKKTVMGTRDDLNYEVFRENIEELNFKQYLNKKIVIKGCGDFIVPPSCYTLITNKLIPYASSIMYGEPCSTVPVYKRKKINH